MRRNAMLAVVITALLVAAPVAAQDGEGEAEAAQAGEEQMDDVVDEAEEAAEDPDAPPTHDWEFALAASGNAPDGEGMVQVTEVDAGSEFRVEVRGLPVVDSLDSEERDVNAYTVWVVPDRDRVAESTLAGVIDVGPEGSGEFTGSTELDTFGIVVTATPDGAPERIGGIPVLTGIPVTSEPSADEVEGEGPPAPEVEGGDDPAPEPEAGPEEELEAGDPGS